MAWNAGQVSVTAFLKSTFDYTFKDSSVVLAKLSHRVNKIILLCLEAFTLR